MKKIVWRSMIACALIAPLSLSSCKGDDDKGGSGDGDGDGDGDTSSGGITGDGDGDTSSGGRTAGTGGGTTGGQPGTGGSPGLGGASIGGEGGMGGQASAVAGSCDAPPSPSPNAISETQLNTTYPTALGGTLLDGLYYLSEMNIYAPATADAHVRARAILIAEGEATLVNVDDGDPPDIFAGSVTTSGNELTLTVSCPAAQSATIGYTATGAELWLFDDSEPNIQVYTRQ